MMNERIRELAKQSTTIEYGVDNGFDRVTFDKEKFALLIVRECIKLLPEDCQSPIGCHTSWVIKEHFGVEK